MILKMLITKFLHNYVLANRFQKIADRTIGKETDSDNN